MSDPATEAPFIAGTRSQPGTAADRKMSTANATATGAGFGLTIGFADWFFQCFSTGHWHYVAPNQQLIEIAAPIMLLPVGLWVGRVLSLIGDIITNHLQKDAGKP